MHKIYKISAAIILMVFFVYSCDAPRENPLDPYNNQSRLNEITGTVKTESFPIEPIPNALLIWRNTGESKFSNSDGSFKFNLYKKNNGYLVCTKTNYYPDSVFIDWTKHEPVSANFYLNQIPSLESFHIMSYVFYSNDSTYNQTINVNARISDRDKDIDSVFLINNNYNFSSNLNYNPSNQIWQKSFSSFEFGVSSFEEIVGKIFKLKIKEKNNHGCEIDAGSLIRVMVTQPHLTSPRADEIIQIPYVFTWEKFPAEYNFSYQIQIYRNEIPTQLAFDLKGISQDSTSYNLEASLQQGNYYWMLYVIDEYGNKVRSKPVSFKIQN